MREHRSYDTDFDHPRDVREKAEHFARDISRLPQARTVLLTSPRSGPNVWVVIEGEPFEDSLRMPVYEAELLAHDAYPETPVSFRLINLTEFSDMQPDELLPAAAEVLWQR